MRLSRYLWVDAGRTFLLAASLCVPLCRPCPGAAAEPAEPPTRGPFIDVPRDHWAYEAVEELRQRGILLGYPSTTERPAASPTPVRQQARPAQPAPRARRDHQPLRRR